MKDEIDETPVKEVPSITGCEDHETPNADCEPCLSKWGYSLDTKNRNALMSVGMLAGRFRPGQSGNPAGRGEGRRSFEAVVEGLLDETQGVDVNGQMTEIEKREALGRVLVGQALRTNPKRWAMELLVGRLWPEESKLDHKFPGRVEIILDGDDMEA
jgi:hypothetical protein